MPDRTVFLTTLGCKINQYETQAIREAWTALRYAPVDDPAAAGVILVNSCAVTARAVADLRGAVRALNRQAPGAAIIVTGCAAEVAADEISRLPGVVRVAGRADKEGLLRGPGLGPRSEAASESGRDGLDPQAPVWPPFAITGYERARAVVKVQDGCSHRCTYCVVPLARGASRTRPLDEAVAEIGRLLDAGFRELVLSGVNLAHFGRDLPGGPDFWDLLALVERTFAPQWAGRARLRMSSLEPGQLTPKALDTLAASRLACPHLHLSLQSGSPGVLGRMGRGHYRPEQVLDFLAGLSRAWPVLGLGADLLAGFPGETEAQAAETRDFVAALPLTYAHVFPYSARPGTPAASFPDQVPGPERAARAARLRGLAEARKRAFAKTLLARPALTMVVEEGGEGAGASGVCEFYASCHLLPGQPEPPRRSLALVRPLAARPDGGVDAVLLPEGA
jgi:MiaB/RimO family radical SAM methylthiotransferase